MSAHDPFAARLHFIPRFVNRFIQRPMTRALRRRIERSPNWVLLTTTGRKSGLPREVLLPCVHVSGDVVVISTYGRRSDWMRNLARDPNVRITVRGKKVSARAEVVEDLEREQRLVTEHPFFAPMPLEPLNRLLSPLMPPFLRRWVISRPVVVFHADIRAGRAPEIF